MSHSHQWRDILEWFGIRLFNDTDFSRVWITKPPVLYLLFHLFSAAKVVLGQVLCVHQWARNYVQQIPEGKQVAGQRKKKKRLIKFNKIFIFHSLKNVVQVPFSFNWIPGRIACNY